MTERVRWMARIMVAGIITCFMHTLSFAVEFRSASGYAVGSNPQLAVIGDFNGDGKPDIAVANTGSNNVSILLGNGDGTFQAAKNINIGNSMTSIAAGDFNGDGKLDLAVFLAGDPSNSVSGEVRILLGTGDGTFQAPVVTTLTTSSLHFGSGDFNGDKKADLIVGNVDSSSHAITLQILLGNGDGTFQAAQAIPSNGLQSPNFAIADFDKDGKLDLAVSETGGVLVLHGLGDGTFSPGANATPLAFKEVSNFWVADVNDDGNLDLIVVSGLTSCSGGTIIHICTTTIRMSVLLGAGNGTFASEQEFAGYSSIGGLNGGLISSITIGDFNGDGKLDVIYRRRSGAGFVLDIRLGKSDGTFATPITMPDPGLIAAGQDLNGDKLTDLVVLDPSNDNAEVLLNDSPVSGTDLGIINSSASPEPVGVGTSLTYSADVMNEGPQDATGVTFTDTLPANSTFVSATASQGSCSQANLVVTCSIGALADTIDAQVTIVVTPNATGSIMNAMRVAGTETDSATANNDATQNSTVVPVYTLTVSKSGNGSGTITSDPGLNGPIDCGGTCSASFLTGTVVNVNASSDSGTLFQNWGGACTGTLNTQGCSLTMNGNKTVSANFVLGITLNVSVAGGGTGSVTSSDGSISCGDTGGNCSSLSLPGTSVSLTATPSGGSVFSGWTGACTGTNPNSCSITLNSNQAVTANIGPPPDFMVRPTAASLTVARGGQGSEQIQFPAQSGFTGMIAVTCSVNGPAPKPTCGVSPGSVGAGGSVQLTVNAMGMLAGLRTAPPVNLGELYAVCLPLGISGCLLGAGFDKKRARRWMACVLALVGSVLPVACGGGGSSKPVEQNYMVTVTGVSGPITHTVNLNVTVE